MNTRFIRLPRSAIAAARMMPAVAFMFLALAACGGDKTAKPAAADSTAKQAAPVAAPGAAPAASGLSAIPSTGKVWVVKMYGGDPKGYRFEPKTLAINVGDAVRWQFESGGPHDVTFWPDSIPKGAEPQLQANMPNTIGPLMAPMTMAAGDNYTVSFAGVPKGMYHYYCLPHLAMGMVAELTVK